MDDTKPGIDLLTKCMSAAVGSASALMAIGASPPKTTYEGMARVAFGAIISYCSTGLILEKMGFAVTVDSVLTCALVLGGGSWWVFTAFIAICSRSNSVIARWIVKKVTGIDPGSMSGSDTHPTPPPGGGA